MQISTLRRIVTALGGELEVFAKFPSGLIRLDQFDGKVKRPALKASVAAK